MVEIERRTRRAFDERRKENAVQPRPLGREQLLQPAMDLVDQAEREIPARGAGLVGDQHRRHASRVQFPDRRGRMRQQQQAIDVVDVADLFGEATVAVNKNSGAGHAIVLLG